MTGSIEHNIRLMAEMGLMLSVFPTRSGQFQANVAEASRKAWTVVTMDDPVAAVNEAMRQRLVTVASREMITSEGFPTPAAYVEQPEAAADPRQIDIEEVINVGAKNSLSYTEQVENKAADYEDLIG